MEALITSYYTQMTNTSSTLVQTEKTSTSTDSSSQPSNQELIQADIECMLHFMTNRGIKIPTTLNIKDTADEAVTIANYNTLIEAVQPTTVQSIRYINNHILNRQGEDQKWHATPIIAKSLIIAGLALVSLIIISLSSKVNAKNMAEGLLASEGIVLLYNLIFICSASLLGVMFYLLKTLSDKIKNYTLLPADALEVNTTIIIGVISGFIVSELFTFNTAALGPSVEMQKMTLALVGGFSSDAIFSILKGAVSKAKTVFATSS